MIKVFSKPNCVQCEQTKRFLSKHNIPYETTDVTKDTEARNLVTELGFFSMPVVVTDHDKWSGFRIDKLNDLLVRYKNDR